MTEDIRRWLSGSIENTFRRLSSDDRPTRQDGHRKRFILRLEREIPRTNILAWLQQDAAAVKFYWRSRQTDLQFAGLGIAERFSARGEQDYPGVINRLLDYDSNDDPQSHNIRYFGGGRFAANHTDETHWRAFGHYDFILPRFELSCREGRTTFACNIVFPEKPLASGELAALKAKILTQVESLHYRNSIDLKQLPEILCQHNNPGQDGWEASIRGALSIFSEGLAQKVVLARKSILSFKRDPNAIALLSLLQRANPSAYHFLYQPMPRNIFLGATPERLYFRENNCLYSEAVAGTRPRGATPEADRRLQEELLFSRKDLHEHRVVLDSILNTFKEVCSEYRRDEKISLLKLSGLQHLYSKIEGRLKPGINDGRLLQGLHPTPAVGGYPDNARGFIATLEGFDRGWYAGPIGWLSRRCAEFAVAIRSGLVENSTLHLFAGAGIVTGSRAAEEWQEIEDKLNTFLSVLRQHQPVLQPLNQTVLG